MTLDQFLPFMLIELPACPEPLMRQALLRAAAEFCRRTNAWNEVQEPVPLVPEVRDYDLEAPSGAKVCAILSIHVGGHALRPHGSHAQMQSQEAWLAGASQPAFYNLVPDRDMVSLYPTPSAAGEIVVRAAYMPTAISTTLPDFLGDRYLEAITGGAKSILMAIPGKPWTNPELVMFHRQRLDDAIVEAAAEELHGRTVGPATVRPRRFGAWG